MEDDNRIWTGALVEMVRRALEDYVLLKPWAPRQHSLSPPALPATLQVPDVASMIARAMALQRTVAGRAAIKLDGSSLDALLLPLNIGGHGVLAAVGSRPPHRCHDVAVVGAGRFVHGDDNLVFGQWNSLVATSRAGRAVTIFPGHGGEIIPGRLSDHIDRLRENIRTGRRLPTQMDIDVSMACPSSCTFCFSAGYRASRRNDLMMGRALMLDLIRKWADEGVRVVRFDGGGDPLTHPHLLDAIRLAHDLGLRTAVLTAGDLLRERHFRTLLEAGTYLRISLNAGNNQIRAAVHQTKNRRLTLNRLLDTVRALADLREETYGSAARYHMLLGATSMITPSNCYMTFETAAAAKRAGFDHLSFRVILGKLHRVGFSRTEHDEFGTQAALVRSEVADESFQVFFPTRALTDQGYEPKKYFSDCMACTHRVLVEVGHDSETAAIVPCGRYRGHGFRWQPDLDRQLKVLGHLTASTSVGNVWFAPRMRSLVQSFPDACNDCIDRSANVFLGRINEVLLGDADAKFFRFSTQASGDGHSDMLREANGDD